MGGWGFPGGKNCGMEALGELVVPDARAKQEREALLSVTRPPDRPRARSTLNFLPPPRWPVGPSGGEAKNWYPGPPVVELGVWG